jgi:dienelactone hydrolase
LRLVAIAVVSCVLFVVCAVSAASAQGTDVSFPSADTSLAITGHLYRPEGSGPFPAVVLLHGCAGIGPGHHRWAEKLRGWGYVALIVNSFASRRETNVCDTLKVDPQYARMPDAYAARAYLARQSFVSPARIGVIGWSHGGSTTLYAVDDVYLPRMGPERFSAAIAFYPGCLMWLQRLNAPLLILIGEADDWTPAARCQRMNVEPGMAHAMSLKIYPGAHHGFDRAEAGIHTYLGHTVGRHPEAASDAEAEVQRFLAGHLAR